MNELYLHVLARYENKLREIGSEPRESCENSARMRRHDQRAPRILYRTLFKRVSKENEKKKCL